ncbi:MAG TPA: phage head closure protein [Devosia sp.]|nr:phage head closure protein [Devosia sp.]
MTILRQTEETNEFGERLDDWEEVRTVRAEKIHKSEDEAFAASVRYERRAVTFRMYFAADVSVTDRLRCDGLIYEIRGIREIGFRRGIDVAAEYQG